MKKIKVGIPRALLYHRYGVLWKNFFELLGVNIVLSPETNQELVDIGTNNTIDECCLSYKIYIGHVIYLKDKCDYVLITRVCDYGKNDKVCTRLNGIYDNVKYLIPKSKILSINIEHTKNKYMFNELFKTGWKLTKRPLKILYSYILAKKEQKKYDISKENEQKNKLTKQGKKVLIISHFYNIKDKYISNYIIEYLNKNKIIPIYSNYLEKNTSKLFSCYFSNTLYWKYSKEMIGSIYYYKHQVDGLIYISTYPCGIDALVNNLSILKNKELPTLNLLIDESVSELNLETKLESFIDIINKNNS